MKAITADRQDVANNILNTKKPSQAKALTSSRNLPMTEQQLNEWNSISKSIMLNLMFDSFDQNSQAKQRLLSTGNSKLTHMRSGIEQDNGRFSEVITTVRDMLREEQHIGMSNKPLTGVDLMSLYEEGNRRISSLLDELELTNEERQTYLNEFAEQLRDDNVNTNDQLEEAIRKFICNL